MRKVQLPELGHQFALDLALEGVLRVRRVANTGVDLGAVVHDAAGIGERLEPPPAVVFAHPRVAHTSKRKFRDQRVDRAVVDRRVARLGRVEDALGDTEVLGKHV